MNWLAHLYSKRLHFCGSCNDAAVVRRHHDHGNALKIRPEYALSRNVKIIAVDEGYRGVHR